MAHLLRATMQSTLNALIRRPKLKTEITIHSFPLSKSKLLFSFSFYLFFSRQIPSCQSKTQRKRSNPNPPPTRTNTLTPTPRAATRATIGSPSSAIMEQPPEPDRKPDQSDLAQAPNGDAKNAEAAEKVPESELESGSGSESRPSPEKSVDRTGSSGSMKKSVRWSPELVTESTFVPTPPESRFNPFFSSSSSFSVMEKVDTVRNVLGRWGRKVGEATRKAETLAGNTWQHLKTNPSFAEAAMGRIAQGTKVLAEGGYEKIFVRTFDTVPEEQLQNCFACYLSTSAGPVMGVLYVSTAKLAYCSDNPLSYKSDNQTEWSYYKAVIPLHQLKAVNPSSSRMNPTEKYIQVISADNHEFWFMGFLNYEGAVDCLQKSFETNKLQSE